MWRFQQRHCLDCNRKNSDCSCLKVEESWLQEEVNKDGVAAQQQDGGAASEMMEPGPPEEKSKTSQSKRVRKRRSSLLLTVDTVSQEERSHAITTSGSVKFALPPPLVLPF